MSIEDTPKSTETSLTRDLLYAARYYLTGKIGLIALGSVALVAGAAFNWSWLVAIGIAPLLLTALPCVVMCALGLCMGGGSKSSGDAQAPQSNSTGDAGQNQTLRLATTDGKADPAGETKEQGKPNSGGGKDCC